MNYMNWKKQIGMYGSCLLFVFSACSNADEKANESTPEVKDTVQTAVVTRSAEDILEDTILKVVMGLPEVEIANNRIDSITSHKKGIAGIIDEPGDGETDYGVRVGYSGDERFEVYYFFYVNPKTFQIRVLDIISDSVMRYEDWHKMKTDEKKSNTVK